MLKAMTKKDCRDTHLSVSTVACHQERRVEVLVVRGKARPGVEQKLRSLGPPEVRRLDQRRPAIPIGSLKTRASLDQQLANVRMTLLGCKHQRRLPR
jgi:hypothetical protein